MEPVNVVLRALVSAVLFPFRGLPPLVGITVVSLVTAIAMLLVFKATSNQSAIAAVKRQIHASLFEIRLFNDDLRAILRAQRELLRHNARYLRHSFAPLLWMIVPFVLLIAQLQFHYGYQPVEPGTSVLVEARLADGWQDGTEVEDVEGFTKPVAHLSASPGVRVETPTLWAPELRELSWRVAVDEPGQHELAVEVAGERYTKLLDAGADRFAQEQISPIRPGRSFWQQLLYPAEPPLPEGPVESISVSYEDADVWFLGWNTHWMVIFFILSIAFAFMLRNRFGVSI